MSAARKKPAEWAFMGRVWMVLRVAENAQAVLARRLVGLF